MIERKTELFDEILLEHCANGSCFSNNQKCDPYVNCSLEYQPLCASNLYNYSNECQMNKYACQSNINLTKLHDGMCTIHEQHRLRESEGIIFFKKHHVFFYCYFSV